MSFKRVVFESKKALAMPASRKLYRQLKAAERLDPEALAALQDERALSHARFAMEHTRFYRERYSDAGFTLKDLQDPAAFFELPIIEKADVREHAGLFRSTEATERNSGRSTTGGSTGEPLQLLQDRRFGARALEWRLFDWWGVNPWDDIAIVYRQMKSARQSAKHRLQWWPTRRFQLNAYNMNAETIAEFLRNWSEARPSLLIGYVGGVAELAREVQRLGIALPAPVAVAVTAAPLTQADRAAMEAAFRAPVYDHYRSAEIPWMAGECSRQDGLHVFSDVRRLEILDEAGAPVSPGVTGEVVLTDMTNRVFPLIRYRLGDRTSSMPGLCGCGVTLPRIRPVAGRKSEALRLPDGQTIAGEGLTQLFSSNPAAVRQFQVHQRSDYSVELRCVPGTAADSQETIARVVGDLERIVRHQVPVRLQVVDSIPHDGGKIRYIKTDIR
jgi:phenylacetate-CoA ligase